MTQTPDLEAFFATLEQLPPHGGVVFRGCEARSHERWAGRAHVTEPLLSTSRDPRVATENFSTEAVYAILSRAGRGDRAVLGGPPRARGRLPAGHDLHAGHARAGQGPRRDDRRGVRPRGRTAARRLRRAPGGDRPRDPRRPSCASRCPSPSPASSPATSRDAAGRQRRSPGRPDPGRPARRGVRRRPRRARTSSARRHSAPARCRG